MAQEQLTNRSFRIYTVLACIFAGAVVAANLMGTKVIDFFSIGGYQFSGSVGIFLFPLTFLVTDVVASIVTMVSQLIDSAIFLLIAFWGVTERFTLGYVLGSMLPPYYVIKIIAALFDTPLVYLGVRFIQRYTTAERSEQAAAPAG